MIRVIASIRAAWICACALGTAASCAERRSLDDAASADSAVADAARESRAGSGGSDADGGAGSGAAGSDSMDHRGSDAAAGSGSDADAGSGSDAAAGSGSDAGAAGNRAGAAGSATSAAGSAARPVAGGAAPLGPPGSNTAWLGGGRPVPCASDEHCVKTLYTPVCDLATAVCVVCPDRDREIALAARVNACILFNSPRCLQDEECRFRDCVTTCDEGP